MVAIRHKRIQADGVALHVAVAGEGPPVVLLHGFPENWTSWRHQFPALVQAGFSVWAPDLRGYNLSDRPAGRAAYHLRHLIDDVAAVVRATGAPRAHIVGHDMGGVIAWTFAGHRPPLVDKLVILNAPHPQIYLKKVRRPPQMFKSWYVLFFQVPRLPELALSARNFSAVRDMFVRMPFRPNAFADADVDQYIRAISSPGALTAALNYYRANLRSESVHLARSARIAADTLVIWGDHDPALDNSLLDGLDHVVPGVQIHRIADSGHWVQNEVPDEVNRVLIDFLCGTPSPP
ncbi:MAG: epoxide hydrolase [Blastocatellia bacterium]|nr:MAG: epoxide hydrolase [Blastocatellia bacterium]